MENDQEKPTVSSPTCTALLCCPFCGSEAGINWTDKNMQSVGCINVSMLCPNPALVVYKKDGEDFDYKFWNERAL
jgi:hypothetical protein